jgi:hypothetical protein
LDKKTHLAASWEILIKKEEDDDDDDWNNK